MQLECKIGIPIYVVLKPPRYELFIWSPTSRIYGLLCCCLLFADVAVSINLFKLVCMRRDNNRSKKRCQDLLGVRNNKSVSAERAFCHTRYKNQKIRYASDSVDIKILGQGQR